MNQLDVDQLEGVVRQTEEILAGVDPSHAGRPTPCPDWDVQALTNHLVAYMRRFAAGVNGRETDEDPNEFVAGPDPARQFREAADDALQGWKAVDPDGEVSLVSEPMPAPLAYNVMLMEEVIHGWDLATATGQPVSFSEQAVADALAAAQAMIQPEYRGDWIGAEVEVPAEASTIERLVAFAGRDPLG